MNLQPWQKMIWDYFGSLPPVPEGYARKWYINRKGRWQYFDIPPKDIYEEPDFV